MTARKAHPEVVRECREDGKGWRINEYGDWFPCAETLGPMLTREEWREKKRAEAEGEVDSGLAAIIARGTDG